jgi:membrane associated rhomboid family serine protease
MRCSRCDRPACPECLREAAVGYQCVDCVRAGAGAASARRPVTVAGAPLRMGKPMITFILIGLNVLVYVITAVQAGSVLSNERSPLFQQWELFPPAVAADGQWWRLVAAGFLHFGPIHILMNMVSLYIIGREVEVVLGRLRFTTVYVVSLFGGGVAAYLLSPVNSAVGGASGAVFGLMGALAVAVVRLKLDPKSVIFLIAINMFISFQLPGISWQGHIGGLITGALVMVGMVYAPAARRNPVQLGTVFGVLVVLVVLYFFRTNTLTTLLGATVGT